MGKPGEKAAGGEEPTGDSTAPERIANVSAASLLSPEELAQLSKFKSAAGKPPAVPAGGGAGTSLGMIVTPGLGSNVESGGRLWMGTPASAPFQKMASQGVGAVMGVGMPTPDPGGDAGGGGGGAQQQQQQLAAASAALDSWAAALGDVPPAAVSGSGPTLAFPAWLGSKAPVAPLKQLDRAACWVLRERASAEESVNAGGGKGGGHGVMLLHEPTDDGIVQAAVLLCACGLRVAATSGAARDGATVGSFQVAYGAVLPACLEAALPQAGAPVQLAQQLPLQWQFLLAAYARFVFGGGSGGNGLPEPLRAGGNPTSGTWRAAAAAVRDVRAAAKRAADAAAPVAITVAERAKERGSTAAAALARWGSLAGTEIKKATSHAVERMSTLEVREFNATIGGAPGSPLGVTLNTHEMPVATAPAAPGDDSKEEGDGTAEAVTDAPTPADGTPAMEFVNVVAAVVPGGAAEEAGLRPGDELLAVRIGDVFESLRNLPHDQATALVGRAAQVRPLVLSVTRKRRAVAPLPAQLPSIPAPVKEAMVTTKTSIGLHAKKLSGFMDATFKSAFPPQQQKDSTAVTPATGDEAPAASVAASGGGGTAAAAPSAPAPAPAAPAASAGDAKE
jgi:hypothetical protein